VRVSWDHWARAERAEIAAADRWRSIRELDSDGPVARLDGCEVVSFASNDYFGLSQHPAVRAAAVQFPDRPPAVSRGNLRPFGPCPVIPAHPHECAILLNPAEAEPRSGELKLTGRGQRG
jgi:hypothetical protein